MALARSRVHDSLWLPCGNAALLHDRFCRMHREALDGAMLGLHAHRDPAERDAAGPPDHDGRPSLALPCTVRRRAALVTAGKP